jgi:2-amino-4-hydroxy-6-hydroxymethyldihydropteridine diphosphokinase
VAQAFVALGSNLDDPATQVARALAAMDSLPETRLVCASRLYRTPPWGLGDQPWFVNAAAELDTRLEPRALLRALLALESRSGRERSGPRWGPRRIDLDLLLYQGRVIDEPGLHLPHPRLAERAFVLLPLADIAPDLLLPDGRRLADLIAQVDAGGIEPLP